MIGIEFIYLCSHSIDEYATSVDVLPYADSSYKWYYANDNIVNMRILKARLYNE